MTNTEAARILIGIMEDIEIEQDSKYYIGQCREAIDKAIDALCRTEEVKIEVIEHHTFAKPEDTTGLKFGD